METLIGFAVGYYVGTQQGRDGLKKARESWDAIRTSPEFHRLLRTGATIAGSAARQVLGSSAGAALTAAVEAVARKAMPEPDRRAA
jgi:hypothetical protein